jgi:RTX calcium-binding nonapeptide repeat (4 copies)
MFGSLIDAFRRFRGRRARAALLAGLIPACLALGGLFPAASSAATRGFKVYNASSYNLVYTGADGNGTIDSGPNSGDVITPGLGYHDFEVTWEFFKDVVEVARYRVVDGTGTQLGGVTVTMSVASYTGQTSLDCEASPGVGDCEINGSVSTYVDDPGSVHDIPAEQAQAQAATLQQLCTDNNMASCSFTPTKRVPVDSPTHPVGHALINNTDEEQETRVTISDTVGSTDSVEIEVDAGVKIFKVVELSVSAKYGHEWTAEHTFEQDVTVHCPAKSKCWITGDDPMWRDTGDYVLTLGNTRWILRNIYIDSPNPSGQGSYEVNEQPLTASELAGLPQAVIQTGTDGNDNITGTNVDDRINAKPGNDTVSARAGDDVLSGGSGNDHVQGGPGDDTINGGTGVDSLAGGSGDDRINARDGRADRVDCGGGHDSAVVDSKDKIAGATAQAPDGNCESVTGAS